MKTRLYHSLFDTDSLHPRIGIGICLFLLAFTNSLPGQAPLFFPAQTEASLPNQALQHVCMNDMGMLWAGGESGLYQFNGKAWRHCPANDSLITGAITTLYLDFTDQLWIGHENGQISQLVGDSLIRFTLEPDFLSQPITGLFLDRENRLWIASYGEGLYWYADQKLSNINDTDGLSDNDIYALTGTAEGIVWLGSDGGISRCELRGQEKNIQNFGRAAGLPDNIVRKLHWSPDGDLWLGTYDQGICLFDTASFQVKRHSPMGAWGYGEIKALHCFSDEIWVGTSEQGLICLDTASFRPKWMLPKPGIHALAADRSGNMWVSSEADGLEHAYAGLRSYPVLSNEGEGILAVATDRSGKVWFSTEKGVSCLDPSLPTEDPVLLKLPGGELSAGITQIAEDAAGWIWMGSFEAGIFRYHPPSQRWQHLRGGAELDNGSVLALASCQQDMWISTLTGLSRIKVKADGSLGPTEAFDRETALGINYVLDLIVDQTDKVWVLTDGQGIFSYAAGTFQKATGDSSFIKSRPVAICMDQQGQIWVCTKDGYIYEQTETSFVARGQATGSKVKEVFAMAALPMGRFLLLNDQGMTVYDPAKDYRLPFRAALGLEGRQLDLYQQSIARHPSGSYWLATQFGLYHFWPPQDNQYLTPRLHFDPVAIFLTEKVDTAVHIFGPDEDHLTFSFAGLWHRDPTAVSYSYFLEGYDLNWTATQDNRITYPRLDPGTYTFRLRTRMFDQLPPGPTIAYSFRILPPIWQRPWFILLGLALVVFGAIMLVRLREARLAERARLEQEKMRFQFETLRNQVNPHFLFNSFNTLAAIIEDDAPGAVNYVNHLSDLFRSMLNFREKKLIPLRTELTVLDTYFFLQQQRYGKNLNLDIQIPANSHERGIPPLTLQMLIENAIKHNVISRNRPLSISIHQTESNYLRVANPLQAKRHQAPGTQIGLQNIQDRYALITELPVQVHKSEEEFIVEIPLLPLASVSENQSLST